MNTRTDDPDADDEAEMNRLLCEALAPAEVPIAHRGALRERLLARVGASAARHAGLLTVRASDGAWRPLDSYRHRKRPQAR